MSILSSNHAARMAPMYHAKHAAHRLESKQPSNQNLRFHATCSHISANATAKHATVISQKYQFTQEKEGTARKELQILKPQSKKTTAAI